MQKLLKILLFSSVLFLLSCSILKKNVNKNQSRVDSTAKVVSSSIISIKKDSTGKAINKITEETKSDNGYTKVTTIKEYLSDEFDFSGYDKTVTISKDSFKVKKPVLIRETTIKEKGKAQTQTHKITESANTSKVNNSDSGINENASEIGVKKDTKTVLKQVDKKKFLLGFIAGIIILGIACYAYKYFKN